MSFIEHDIAEARKTADVPSPLDAMLWLRARLHTRTKRRAIVELLKADSERLEDVGVTREDIRAALAEPGDAAQNLHRIARKRRCLERHMRCG